MQVLKFGASLLKKMLYVNLKTNRILSLLIYVSVSQTGVCKPQPEGQWNTYNKISKVCYITKNKKPQNKTKENIEKEKVEKRHIQRVFFHPKWQLIIF